MAIAIPRGSKAVIPIIIFNHQPEGMYYYKPSEGEKIIFILKMTDNTEVSRYEIAIKEDLEPCVELNTDIPEGFYIYDVHFITKNADDYIIAHDQDLVIT